MNNDQDFGNRLLCAGTSTLSDALDRLGISGQALGIMPVARNMRFAGRAFTIRMVPVGQSGGSVGDYIDDVAPGRVVVIDNGGRLDATVWGDILTWVAVQKGIAGTVIDGVCRDTDRCVELDYPVFARGHTMRTAKDRMTADAYNVTVQIAGVRVDADDWVVGDADGVVILPAACMEKILCLAEEIEQIESLIRSAVQQGRRLSDARADFNYHKLQTPE